jgi:uncharacterized protein
MNDFNDALIGRGAKYPLNTDFSGGLEKSSSLERINQSINIILDTPVGQRLMLPDFGSRIQDLRFEPLDVVMIEQIDNYIREDLRKWEPRITILGIDFKDNPDLRDQSTLFVSIRYQVINTKVEGNYVYPFSYGPRPITEVR